jgi:hypothetical protein
VIGLRRLTISSQLLTGFFLGSRPAYDVTANGLPADARVVGVSHDLAKSLIELTLASASWDGPIECGAIPELPMIVFSIRDGATE